MLYICDCRDINKIQVKDEELFTLHNEWYVEAVCYPENRPVDWLDIKIRRKENEV